MVSVPHPKASQQKDGSQSVPTLKSPKSNGVLKPGQHTRFGINIVRPLTAPVVWAAVVQTMVVLVVNTSQVYDTPSPSSRRGVGLLWGAILLSLLPAVVHATSVCSPTLYARIPKPLQHVGEYCFTNAAVGNDPALLWTWKAGLHCLSIQVLGLICMVMYVTFDLQETEPGVYGAPLLLRRTGQSVMQTGLMTLGIVWLSSCAYHTREVNRYQQLNDAFAKAHSSLLPHLRTIKSVAEQDSWVGNKLPSAATIGSVIFGFLATLGPTLGFFINDAQTYDEATEVLQQTTLSFGQAVGLIVLFVAHGVGFGTAMYWCLYVLYHCAWARYQRARATLKTFHYLLDADTTSVLQRGNIPDGEVVGDTAPTSSSLPGVRRRRTHAAELGELARDVSPSLQLRNASSWYTLLLHCKNYELPYVIGRAETIIVVGIIVMFSYPAIVLATALARARNGEESSPLALTLLAYGESGPFWTVLVIVLIAGSVACIMSAGMLGDVHQSFPSLLDHVAIRYRMTQHMVSRSGVVEPSLAEGGIQQATPVMPPLPPSSARGLMAHDSVGSAGGFGGEEREVITSDDKYVMRLVRQCVVDNPYSITLLGVIAVDPVKIKVMFAYLASAVISGIVTSIRS